MYTYRIKSDQQVKDEMKHFLYVLSNSESLDRYFQELILAYLDIIEREEHE